MQRILLLAIALGTGLAALAIVGFYFYERPTFLRVAVARGGEQQRLLVALNQEFVRTHADLRLRLVPTADERAAAKSMEDGKVDLAVVRSDVAMPTDASTVLILAHEYAVIVAPAGVKFANVPDLKGKRVAIIASGHSGDENEKLLDTIESQYSLPPDAIKKKLVDQSDLPKLLREGAFDAVLAFGAFDSPRLAEVVETVSQAATPPASPVFIPILEAGAIAKKFPGLESAEILRGAFGGSPSRPAEKMETLGATIRLVARNNLANATVGDVTRLILANRAAAAITAPSANHIEAPETEKGGVLPTHPGAAAFLDGEEETFLDRYSDFIYIGAMVGSVLISALATLASRLTVQGYARFDKLIEQTLTILKDGREAKDSQALDKAELEIDEILTQSLAAKDMPKLDAHQLAALSLAVQQARVAIAERRAELARHDPS